MTGLIHTARHGLACRYQAAKNFLQRFRNSWRKAKAGDSRKRNLAVPVAGVREPGLSKVDDANAVQGVAIPDFVYPCGRQAGLYASDRDFFAFVHGARASLDRLEQRQTGLSASPKQGAGE